MGFESYLLVINFKKPLAQEYIVALFENSGATYLATKSDTDNIDSFRHYYFEIRTDLGLTEMEILLTPHKTNISSFYLRFSILSPSSVIDQSFNFLMKLGSKKSIIVLDPEINSQKISLDVEEFKRNSKGIRKRQIVINNTTGIVIEGGGPTMEYIYKNNLMDKILKIDYISSQLKDFIARNTDLNPNEIKAELKLAKDIGFHGLDAIFFFEAFFKEFEIKNIEDFDADSHIDGGPDFVSSPLTWIKNLLKKGRRKYLNPDVTLKHLDQVIQRGKVV